MTLCGVDWLFQRSHNWHHCRHHGSGGSYHWHHCRHHGSGGSYVGRGTRRWINVCIYIYMSLLYNIIYKYNIIYTYIQRHIFDLVGGRLVVAPESVSRGWGCCSHHWFHAVILASRAVILASRAGL